MGFSCIIDLIFVAANATKLARGRWFPLLLAALVLLPDADLADGLAASGGAALPTSAA